MHDVCCEARSLNTEKKYIVVYFPTLSLLHNLSMSSSRTTEDTYEAQNDQRLDELHSKIRTLRGV